MQIDSIAIERFWNKVSKSDSCWIWTGSRTAKGYGIFSLNGKRKRAHQISYISTIGPIPEGLQLDHLCRNPSCVNPSHLEPVTPRENTLRGIKASTGRPSRKGIPLKELCKHGHPYSGDNLYFVSTTGRRACRACMTAASEKQRASGKFREYQRNYYRIHNKQKRLARLEAQVEQLRRELNL